MHWPQSAEVAPCEVREALFLLVVYTTSAMPESSNRADTKILAFRVFPCLVFMEFVATDPETDQSQFYIDCRGTPSPHAPHPHLPAPGHGQLHPPHVSSHNTNSYLVSWANIILPRTDRGLLCSNSPIPSHLPFPLSAARGDIQLPNLLVSSTAIIFYL